jgi:hypothetical protein
MKFSNDSQLHINGATRTESESSMAESGAVTGSDQTIDNQVARRTADWRSGQKSVFA